MTPEQEIIALSQRIPKWEWWNSFTGITAIVMGVVVALLAVATYTIGNKVGELKDRRNYLENQILKDFQAPRKLTTDQINVLVSGLKKIQGTSLFIMNANLDDEGQSYKAQILKVFNSSGIQSMEHGTYAAEIVGVTISVSKTIPEPAFVQDMISVFQDAKVPVHYTNYWGGKGEDGKGVQIIFGNKPRMR